MHLLGRWRVVDQFNQTIAENYFARCYRQILADDKGVRRDHLDILGLNVTLEPSTAVFPHMNDKSGKLWLNASSQE